MLVVQAFNDASAEKPQGSGRIPFSDNPLLESKSINRNRSSAEHELLQLNRPAMLCTKVGGVCHMLGAGAVPTAFRMTVFMRLGLMDTEGNAETEGCCFILPRHQTVINGIMLHATSKEERLACSSSRAASSATS
eukprot:1136336-Pelagomonas_calceolata.AAC.3